MTWLQIVQVAAIVLIPAVLLTRWHTRRTALRRLAETHGLRFRGMLPSDKYSPYSRFEDVRRGVLLDNVMEGRWNGFDIALFDLPRRGGKRVGVIVDVPRDSTRFQVVPVSRPWIGNAIPEHSGEWTVVTRDGPEPGLGMVIREAFPGSADAIGRRTATLLRSTPGVLVETNVGYLFVLAPRRVAPDGVPDFVELALSLARALDADAERRP